MENKLEKYKNFCPVPWKQFASTTDGYQRTCCTMSLTKEELLTLGYTKDQLDNCTDLEDGLYIFNNKKKLKVSDGIDSYINSDSTKNIKRLFVENKQPYQCRCYLTEQLDTKNSCSSRRTSYLSQYGLHNDSDVEKFLKNDQHIDYYDIRLGNVCNLQCVMCTGAYSNQLYDQDIYRSTLHYEMGIATVNDPDVMFNSDGETKLHIKKSNGKLVYDKDLEKEIFDWANDDFFVKLEERIVQDLSHDKNKVVTFYMIGGEPLLNDPHFKFLERMVKLGLSKNINLEYNTNLTALTDSIIDLWSNFNKLILAISIDDIEERYEYIRYPGKWSKILNNLELISQAVKKHPEIFQTVNIVSVVNLFSAYNFSSLVDLAAGFNINVSKIISTGPTYTTPSILTEQEKEAYIKLIKQDSDYDELAGYVRSFGYSEQARNEFFHMLKYWETKRRIPFRNAFSALAEILNIKETATMILGIGTDITSVDRFMSDHDRMNKLAEKILTNYELEEYSQLQDNKSNFLAKHWAAKEAISKAFGTGISGDTKWKNIELRTNKFTGAPIVCFYDNLKQRSEVLGIRCHISISDEGNTVMAYSVVEYQGTPTDNTKVLYGIDNHA